MKKAALLFSFIAFFAASGFFVAPSVALADVGVTANVTPNEIDVGQTVSLDFGITSSVTPLVKVGIDYSATGFGDPVSATASLVRPPIGGAFT